MHRESSTSLPARPSATHLRPLHTKQTGVHDGSPSTLLTWSSSLGFPIYEPVALQAFVELVSYISVERGEALCIQDTTHGGFIEARMDGTELAAGNWSIVHYNGNCDNDLPTDFSIGPGKAIQLHITSDGKVQIAAHSHIIPQPALLSLGQTLQDILMRRHGTENIEDSDHRNENENNKTGPMNTPWTQPSLLNWPPRQCPVELWPGESALKLQYGSTARNAKPVLLHSWFERMARDIPHRIAIEFLTDLESGTRLQFTYQQVSNCANALASELIRLAAASGDHREVQIIAVAVGPCPELYVGYLAALKAGLAFCPLPVDAPKERQEALLADLKPVAILIRDKMPIDTALVQVNVSDFLSGCDEKTVPQRSLLDRPSASDTSAAYIIYTSGTTGLPKGVVVSHRSAACTVSALSQHYGFSPSAKITEDGRTWRWFQGAAPTFDISLFEIFWTLSTGSTLCCAPRHLTMQNIDAVLSTLQANITNVTPSFASLISPSVLTGLMVGGETLNARLLQNYAQHNPDIPPSEHEVRKTCDLPRGIFNGYGPTEVAMYSLAQPHVPADQRGSVIGSPLATCGILIVEANRHDLIPIPRGGVGELVLTGPQVSMAGYLNRPDETRAAFVDDQKWGRAYRTGDRARIVWNDVGEPVVEFLGRFSDAQVKLSGRRVELGEIESVLASKADGVQQTLSCVWMPQGESSTNESLGSERVVNLVVVDHTTGLDFAIVSANCAEAARQHLPDYMRPFRILEVADLPRSASGKVDRRAASAYVEIALRQPTATGTGASQGQTAVDDLDYPKYAHVEAELVKILSSLIGGDEYHPLLTATTKLALVGIDSLRAMRLLREIRNRNFGQDDSERSIHFELQPSLSLLLDPEASIRSVFFGSASISSRLRQRQMAAQQRLEMFAIRHTAASLEKLSSMSEDNVEMVLPMTSTASQLAVSFAMDSRNYISSTVLRLQPGVSMDSFEVAVRTVLSRHDVYRSTIVPCSDDMSPFAQVVLTPLAWKRSEGHSTRVVRRRGTGNTQYWLRIAQENMDFDAQKLYYVQLVEPDAGKIDRGLVIISIAHCLCDGASVKVLLSDIAREYAGLEPLQRHSLRDSVLDWAQNLDIDTDRYWQDSLRDWETDSFHALSGDNVKATVDQQSLLAEYPSSISWPALEVKSRNLGASPLAILQAAWSLLLGVWSEANKGEIVFGSVLSGQHEAFEAPTFSVVPCRVALPENQTLGALLVSLVDTARFMQSHRHMSFGLFRALPYNTALALQAYGTETEADVPWTVVTHAPIRYDLDVFAEVVPEGDALLFKVTYHDNVLSETSARVIVHQFAALTETLLDAGPNDLAQSLLARLPHRLLSVEGSIPIPTDHSENQERIDVLHAQFESQAASTPDLLALSFYTSLDAPPINMTYAELDSRANGLANIIRLEDADIIPICMHRSIELYVSILAILKAGSAWSPIDETSPVQRRTSLISRTKGKVLLTTRSSFPLVEPCLSHESLADVRVIFVDDYAGHAAKDRPMPRKSVVSRSRHSSFSSITGQDLAYLLWTSGTTGEPKGVMIQHRAAANAMRDLQVRVEHDVAGGPIRTLQLSAYSFDVFVQDLFYTWGLAGSVISGTRELVLGTFSEFVKTAAPTHAHLTPSFGASIDVRDLAGSTLRVVTFIGEKLTEDVADAWAAPEITTKAYNTYGPAENAVVSTMRQFSGKSRDRAKASNVGFPLTPCTAYVVREVFTSPNDERSNTAKKWELVPRYGVGELALGGVQLGMGYLNDETKTAKSFIHGGPQIGERIYLTGDMVRLNDHGFEFLGRNDDLIKISGIRIELSEISAACALVKEEEPAVEHVETLYLPRPNGDASHKVIVSFVSVKETLDYSLDTTRIRRRVFKKAREVLPAHMVPGHVAVLDSTMPRTASNKVDRRELQSIYSNSDLNGLAGVSAEIKDGALWRKEQLPIVEAVMDNLAVPKQPLQTLNPDDSLAGHGVSSLQITKLAWALRRSLKCDIRVLELMRCQTMGELVDVVLVSVTNGEVGEVANTETTNVGTCTTWFSVLRDELTQNLYGTLRPSNTSYILPTTPVQEALLVETMIEPGAYWSHRLFTLKRLGLADMSHLRAAWEAATKRFDILRTAFVPLSQLSPKDTDSISAAEWARTRGVHATVLQVVLHDTEVDWTEISDTVDVEGCLASHAREIQTRLSPLCGDCARPPWALVYAPATMTLMLSMHHSLYDGESSKMLLDVVTQLYRDPSADTGRSGLPLLQMSRGLEVGLVPSVMQRQDASAAWAEHLSGLIETDGAVNAPFPDLTGSRQLPPHAILSAKTVIPFNLLSPASPAPDVGTPDLSRLLLSAFGCVLAAILELKTVVLGQTVSQRILHTDLQHVVGPAIATIPVAIRSCAASALALWAEMARDASSLGALAHHLHPVDIKKMVNKGSENASEPFPALFVYHPAAGYADKDNNSVEHLFYEVGVALPLKVEHPLALNIFEGDGTIELTGDARRISQSMLDLLLVQIVDQASAMLAHPGIPLSRLANHLDRALVSIVGEPRTLVGSVIARNPAELVTKQATDHPDWVAIEEIFLGEDDSLSTAATTFGELEILVNAISSRLIALTSAAAGDVVAVYLERDTTSLAAILAIFKLNYVYLPIDGDLPLERKRLLIRDANAKVVVTTETLVRDLELDNEQNKVPAVFLLPEGNSGLATIQSWASHSQETDAIPTTTSDDGGYLLYTSGSTGQPKGVRVANESLLHFVAAMTQRLTEANSEMARLGGRGKFLNVASRAFDTHLTTMFAPWHLGFSSVIGKDRNGIFANLQHVINTVGITNMGTVPSVLLRLGLQLSDVPSIRVMTFGGEKASHALFDQLRGGDDSGDGSNAALMNFYGPTEATVGCLSHVIGHHSNARNLGLPLPGLEALLLVSNNDSDEQVVARRGQPGEFCISGPQVAVGYLNRPDENARSFQDTSLLDINGTKKRIYRTGDIMRMMHDSTVEFLGRRDQQTKIRGQRFEIGEVEEHIKMAIADQGPFDVTAAVVDQRLIGLVARKIDSLFKAERDAPAEILFPPPSQAHRDVLIAAEKACQRALPAYMVPEMMWLSKIPFLAASGKLDTKHIANLVRNSDTVLDSGIQCPRISTAADCPSGTLSGPEKEVLSALTEVLDGLNNTCVSSSSNLRSLGIDSLSGVHLLSVLKRRGFVNVMLTDIISPSQSLHSLSRKFNSPATSNGSRETQPSSSERAFSSSASGSLHVEELTLDDLGPSASHIVPSNIAAILPCLPLQSVLISLSLNWLYSGHASQVITDGRQVPYVTRFNYQLAPGTNITAWKQAAGEIASSEAILRTCFVQRDRDGKYFQVVLTSTPSPFDIEGSQIENDECTTLVEHLGSRPPFRLRVEESGLVTLLIHHALYDGAAIVALKNKIEQAYHAITSGIPVTASRDDSLTTLRYLASHLDLPSHHMHSARVTWQAKLAGISPCRVECHSLVSNQSSKHDTARATRLLSFTVSELKTKLQSVSLPSAFQLATVLVLASLTPGSSSIVYGYTTSFRTLLPQVAEDMDSLVGPCINTVVHALLITDPGETLRHLAARVEQNHADVSQGDMPFITADQIQRWAGVDEKLFDSLLTVNFIDDTSDDASAPAIMRALPANAMTDMALAIDVEIHSEGRIELLLASGGVLDKTQLDHAGRLFEIVVENAARNDATVDQFVPVNAGSATENNDSQITNPKTISIAASVQNGTQYTQSSLGSVRSVACRLLHLSEEDVPLEASLYRLGLDSINVLPFVKMLNKLEGTKITPNAVLSSRTLQGVASLVCATRNQGASLKSEDNDVVPVVDMGPDFEDTLHEVARDLLFVATPLQEGMLSASLALADQAYTYTHSKQISASACQLDAPAFSHFFDAVRDTVLSCEILRTRFILTDNQNAPWVGIVSSTQVSDLVDWQVSASGIIRLHIHHALYDANSIRALWRLLSENYAHHLSGTIAKAEKQRPFLYRPFAKQVYVAQRTAVAFWVNTVQDYNYVPVVVSSDGVTFTQQRHASSSFHFIVGTDILSALQTTCRKANVALKTSLQLSWAKVLCERLYSHVDMVFGEVITTTSDDVTITGDEAVVMGPTINTIPMRLRLGPNVNIADALSQLQRLGDQARGPNGMASLREVQTAWRSSRSDGIDTSAGLFQSLFVFDGDVSVDTSSATADEQYILPVGTDAQTVPSNTEKEPMYDDYPFISSFRIHDGVLHGALRTKVSEDATQRLGSQLAAALHYLASASLHSVALDPDISTSFPTMVNGHGCSGSQRHGSDVNVDIKGSTELAESVLQLAIKVVGSRIRGKVGYATKLINVGLDSISAIRFSNMLKKNFNVHVSVFDIMKGASIESIVREHSAIENYTEDESQQLPSPLPERQVIKDEPLAKSLAAEILGLQSVDQIQSVLPVLAGQKHTLQHWLHSGKRFFEAPWVYRVSDGKSISVEKAANAWTSLCCAHDILRTTIVAPQNNIVPGLVQVTFNTTMSPAARFTTLRDDKVTIKSLVETYVRETNNLPSDLRSPPSRLSFLEAADGQAIVFRMHHSLYDAWSIKMILGDLLRLFDGVPSLPTQPSLRFAMHEIFRFRSFTAEQAYWKRYLSGSQDTIIRPTALSSTTVSTAPLGFHFRASYPDVASTSATANRMQTSSAIIASYACALGQITDRVRPTFGVNYSARSLSSPDGAQTLELTDKTIPTMAVVPVSIDLKGDLQPLRAVQDHLAALTKFAQADDLHMLAAPYNTHINILFSDADKDTSTNGNAQGCNQGPQRYHLGEPLASEYFTTTVAHSDIQSTVESVDTSWLAPENIYLNVVVRSGSISVDVSCDEDLARGDGNLIVSIVDAFAATLSDMIAQT